MSKTENAAMDPHTAIQAILIDHSQRVKAKAETGEIDPGVEFVASVGAKVHEAVAQVCESEGGAAPNEFFLRAVLHGMIDQAAWIAKTAEQSARTAGVELQNMNDGVTEFDATDAAKLMQRFTTGVQQLPAALVLRDGLRDYADATLADKWVPREQRRRNNQTPAIELDDASKIGDMMKSVLGSVRTAA